jgi:glycine hydroxymethyltransferase
MDLLHGGHLSHGSHVNRSGKNYNIISYGIDDETEQMDYDHIRALALEHKPKMIIAGFSSYSWVPDWTKFREIADEVGAYLLCDISHIGGLTAAGVVPSPMGIADVIMSTTHKSLHGPRGAVLMTTNAAISRKIDRAVFPGEQGGPHINTFVGLALAFKLAKTEDYKELQQQTIDNAVAMVDQFQKRGLKVPFGGTNTHLINIDCRSIKGPDGATLSGDMASRILDVAGLVVNRNTIPGDRSALAPSGIRLGTPWITQRGFDEAKSRELADIISDVLLGCEPYYMDVPRKRKPQRRANIPFELLNDAKLRIRKLALEAGMDFEPVDSGYPHFYYIDDAVNAKDGWAAYDLQGQRVRQMLDYAVSADVSALGNGDSAATCVHTPTKIVKGTLTRVTGESFRLSVPEEDAALASTWLRDLSDGYVSMNVSKSEAFAASRVPGPFVVAESDAAPTPRDGKEEKASYKPFFAGIDQLEIKDRAALPDFEWQDPADPPLQRTALFDVHKELGGKLIPFAGWEMPVWYTNVKEEHLATRKAAGLFDVAHMGVYDVRGDDAASFLDTVCGNDIGGLNVGNSLYTHFLTPDGDVIDDTLVYRRGREDFLVVVNASNDDKDRTWLESVRDGVVKIDNKYPWARTYGYNAEIRNLRDPKMGDAMKVDIALQGPRSRDVLLAMGVDDDVRARIMSLGRTQLCDATVGGFDLIVSRTGYTGEKMAFELFVHPERAAEFWMAVLKAGEKFGVMPIGLGARDSLRTEFGLPLYGHEMGLGSGQMGQADLGVAEGGFGSYVKTYKPYFIGRDAYIANEKKRKSVVVRFTFTDKVVRMAHNGDPVMDGRGKVIGWVTSCAVDGNGYITGQAYLPLKYAEKDTPIYIYQSASDKADKAPAELMMGNKATMPSQALVVTRFAKL